MTEPLKVSENSQNENAPSILASSQGIEQGQIEDLPGEMEDEDSGLSKYDLITYPADLTLDGLVSRYQKQLIITPGFQRKFVWSIKQSSRLIESFLLGLPVPAIFLYTEPDTNKQIVIDGQQRLLSIVYFFEGYFGETDGGKRTVFSLKGLHESSPYYEKTYQQLQEENESIINKLNDTVLRAFIIKQLAPENDNSSIFHIFERLNTGGSSLTGQEIRNCIYYGPFNDLLFELNQEEKWRQVFGSSTENKRQRDIELILRFFALYYWADGYKKPMKDFLSRFMKAYQNPPESKLEEFEQLFKKTTEAIISRLKEKPKPFHIRAGLNAAVFDSIYVAFARNLQNIPENVLEKYKKLVKDEKYLTYVSSGTTAEEVVKNRLKEAEETLFKS